MTSTGVCRLDRKLRTLRLMPPDDIKGHPCAGPQKVDISGARGRRRLELDHLADELALAHRLERIFDLVEPDAAVDEAVDR
jgi:hypothetical protein